MATTTNFGWETPDDTDLVKDGAAAMRTLGNAIDTSFVDLKGGTTGQVLTKASNSDLDYSWSSVDPLVILDAKGDLISATAADTPARLAVGTNGQVLTADSTASTGLKWATPASGGWTLLSTTTLTGSSVNCTAGTGYKDIVVYISSPVASTAANIKVRPNGYSGTEYFYNHYNNSSTAISNTSSDSSILLANIGTVNGGNLACIIQNADSSSYLCGYANGYSYNGTNVRANFTSWMINSSTPSGGLSTVTILLSSGTFSSGTAYVYGVK